MIALIDADMVVYGSAFKAQSVVDFGDGHLVSSSNVSVATADAGDRIEELRKAVDADRVVLALSDPDNCHRRNYYPPYKSSRRLTMRPLGYHEVRDYLKEKYEVIQRPGLEGDDVLGIIATGDLRKFRGDKVIVSIDKDMGTIPGMLYNPMHPEDGIFEVTESRANYCFYMQVLTGDRTDGYPGCPAIGPVKAARILASVGFHFESKYKTEWEAIERTYKLAGLTQAYALSQARCARILRASDYNFETKEVIPWTP